MYYYTNEIYYHGDNDGDNINGDLNNSKTIMKNSFFIGIHTGIKKQQQQYVIDTFNEFISKRVRR